MSVSGFTSALPRMIRGTAETVIPAPGTTSALPRNHLGTVVSADHSRVSSEGLTVSVAVPPSPMEGATVTDIRVAPPTAPAVSWIWRIPSPESSGRVLPSTVHSKSAVSRSKVGVDAVTVKALRGAGDEGDEESEICELNCACTDTAKPNPAIIMAVIIHRLDILPIFIPEL